MTDMKKLFENFWLVFGAMLAVAIVDLWGLTLPGEREIGLGFILCLLFFVAFLIRKWRQ